ncbi:MAG: hypothetical protein GY906_24605 [bacterium]|nr:hypothetical protein [bacterium]
MITNKEIAEAITSRLLEKVWYDTEDPGLRRKIQAEIEWALLTLRIDPWPEEERKV